MGGWVGWLFLFAGAYLAAVVARGIVHLFTWCFDDPLGNRRNRRWHEEHRAEQHELRGAGQSQSAIRRKEAEEPARYPNRLALALAILSPAHWLAETADSLRVLFFRGSYDFWVGRSLRETDPRKKVAELSKALALNPSYEPAWGLKANTLLKMDRYAEALECFEKVLELRPSATAWYKKGLCCYYLKRPGAALECFGRAIASCPQGGADWLKDAAKKRDLLEQELRHQGIP